MEIYGQVREERLYAKRNGLKVKNETLKLALNGATGNYQNEYSWLYDPVAVMKIRINGQLLLLMLAERLISIGCRLIQLNTDGILYTVQKDKYDKLQAILKEWESLTKLTLETEEFEAFYQYAVNDYLAIYKGYKETKDQKLLKKKGLFIDFVTLGKGMNAIIIPKAINNYFANNIPIKETIYNSRDLNDFITYQKVAKDFSIEYNTQLIQRINRYYASTNGAYLYKCKVNNDIRSDYEVMLSASGVTIVNNFADVKEFPNNINYDYYISEANKIIRAIENKQLTFMFND